MALVTINGRYDKYRDNPSLVIFLSIFPESWSLGVGWDREDGCLAKWKLHVFDFGQWNVY